MEIDDLKKLRPDERIKRLKELEKSRKEEIEKAQDMIRSSEDELRIEEELKDIPIPQVKAVDIEQLFSAEERTVFKTKRFIHDEMADVAPEASRPKKSAEEESLEQTVSREAPESAQQGGPVYGLSSERVRENLENLYELTSNRAMNEITDMRNRVAGGIWSQDDDRRLQYRMGQMERASESEHYARPETLRRFEEEETLVNQIREYRRRIGV